MAVLFEGELTGHIGRLIFGWAWCPVEPLRRVYVEILLDGVSVSCVAAQLYNADLKAQHKGTGYYTFSYALPYYALKTTKIIQAKFANQSIYLDGKISMMEDEDSQKKLLPLEALLHHNGGLTIGGKMLDPFDRFKVFKVECFYQGNKIAKSQTENTIGKEGLFTIQLPEFLADGIVHEIDVKSEDGISLPGSPIKVWAQPDGAMSLLNSLNQANKNNNQKDFKKAYDLVRILLKNHEQYLPKSIRLSDYHQWSVRYEPLNRKKKSSRTFILIIVTVSDGDIVKTLKSLRAQAHSNWCAFVEGNIPAKFKQYSNIQQRPETVNFHKTFHHSKNLLTFIEAGDTLSVTALQQMVSVFESNDAVGLVYSDCDQETTSGQKINPWFKPAWDPDLFLSHNYINALCVVDSTCIKQLPNDIQQLPWLAVENMLMQKQRIMHLPHVLYHHYYQKKESTSAALKQLQWCRDYLQTQEASARVIANPNAPFLRKIVRQLPEKPPLISLIIPTKDQAKLLKTCVESIEQKSTYQAYEIIIVDNQTTDEDALLLLDELQKRGHKVIQYHKTFNYSAINNVAVKHAKGDIIGLINNDIEIITADWMEEMLTLLLRPNIGAVGAKLLWPNDMVQHGGVVLGINNLAGHIGNNQLKTHLGYHGLLQVTHRVGAVTAACLLTRKADYLNVGGLDELSFPVAFNDVAYCLKLAKNNLACVWSPFARMIHAESMSRGKDDSPEKTARARMEMGYLRDQWTEELMTDRYYHPSLSLNSLDAPFSALALPPRNREAR
jgi:GT2 family glycosyltransferase